MNNTNTAIAVGDFITIPAWRAFGMVIATRPAMMGSHDAQEVLLESAPEGEHGRTEKWYRVEPNEFEFES